MDGNYYLGLDMGTSSCGWSVTDEEYHVLRRHGKALWECVYLKVLRQQKKGVCTGQAEEDWTDEVGELIYCRSYLQKKSVRSIRDFF